MGNHWGMDNFHNQQIYDLSSIFSHVFVSKDLSFFHIWFFISGVFQYSWLMNKQIYLKRFLLFRSSLLGKCGFVSLIVFMLSKWSKTNEVIQGKCNDVTITNTTLERKPSGLIEKIPMIAVLCFKGWCFVLCQTSSYYASSDIN